MGYDYAFDYPILFLMITRLARTHEPRFELPISDHLAEQR